jgi:hypothetical protein
MLGVHVIADPDPAAAALRMADADDVEVVTDRAQAEAAFTARAEAGRAEVVVIGERERADLEAAAASAAPGTGPVTPEAVAEIRQLADELRRIDRIRKRTEDRFTEKLSERLAAGSGLALHPDTLRAAGRAVVEADAEIARLERELHELDDPDPETVTPARPDDTAETTRQPKSRRRGGNRLAALGVALIAVGVAIGVIAVGAPPAVAAGIAVVGLIVALVLWIGRRGRRSPDRDEPAPPPIAPAPAPRPTPAEHQADMVTRARLETGLERAREGQRSAQRHWQSLAGPEADAHDIEAVLRLRDPQYVVGAAAARASPTMRTVNAVQRRALARWYIAWRAVGYDDPPTLGNVEGALRELAVRPSVDPDAARERLAAADAWTQASATIDRTLVLVEPNRWLPVDDLTALMGMLPAGAEVVVLQRGG